MCSHFSFENEEEVFSFKYNTAEKITKIKRKIEEKVKERKDKSTLKE